MPPFTHGIDDTTGPTYQPFVPQPESSFIQQSQPSALETFQQQMREVQARLRTQQGQRQQAQIQQAQIQQDNERVNAQQDLINDAEIRSLSIPGQPAQSTPIADAYDNFIQSIIDHLNRPTPQEPRAI